MDSQVGWSYKLSIKLNKTDPDVNVSDVVQNLSGYVADMLVGEMQDRKPDCNLCKLVEQPSDYKAFASP